MPAGLAGARRQGLSGVLLLGGLAGVVACGARAMVSDDGGDALGGAGGAGAAASAGRSAGGSSPIFVTPDEPEDGPCARPFLRSRAGDRQCPFVVDGFCHQEDRCACSAACDPGEQCVISGFLSEEEPQRVSCVDLR